ncbi:MAG: 3-deoxy-8-phosphooctulonate synthase [Nitrospinota bacterium]|nr:3-deoxy-8-phosphooctulonate synthase [Nitrospinota bacterium]MDH5677299.1 3-deoxy-8-phosphooctulonate synthase [Nitrospinota bacterium]MDH5756376.1 3-deoxy-8-phosphooctulonate synthase [Nitrospinota bacterium]
MKVDLEYNNVVMGDELPFVFIGGPCVIESEESAMRTAQTLAEITRRVGVGFIYKSSYDKANRSSADAFRGPGVEEGLRILQKVRREVGAPVLTDFHIAGDAPAVGEVVDIVQVPAFLCRQSDILTAAGATGKVVNVKKGQFMAPWEMGNAVEKVRRTGNQRVTLTERGTFFGYNSLVVDMTSLVQMGAEGIPVVFDAGHSVQRPGGLGHASGGNRAMIPPLARAAVATGVAAVFLETHPNPDKAPCDGPNMWPMDQLADLLRMLKRLDESVKG